MTDTLTLTINGMIYAGWTEWSLERRIDRLQSGLTCTVTERWANQGQPWQIHRFDMVTAKIGSDVILTGYVYDVAPRFDAMSHTVTISAVSLTRKLLDATPDIPSGQFRGYTLEAICRAVCGLFGIGVVVNPGTDVSQTFPDATLQRCETAFTFLERLGRLAAVLLSDDGMGRLVLTTAGAQYADGAIIQGYNVKSANAKLTAQGLASIYIVKGQRALGSTAPGWGGAGGTGAESAAPSAPVATTVRAQAVEGGVPFYLPHVSLAEAQLDNAGMQRRANWERNYAYGRSTEAQVTLVGYRQPDKTLWPLNRLIAVTIPWLQIDQAMLIAGVKYSQSDSAGSLTELSLGPIEGYTPDPGEVKLHAKKGHKGRGGSDSNWSSAGS